MQNIKKLIISIRICHRNYSKLAVEDIKHGSKSKVPSVQLCMELFGMSNAVAHRYVKKYPEIQKVDPQDAKLSFQTLLSIGIPINDIQNSPSIFHTHPITLKNRGEILSETGFKEINIAHLHKFLRIIPLKLDQLKEYQWVDPATDIPRSLTLSFGLEPSDVTISPTSTLEDARKVLLEHYLRRVLQFNDDDFIHTWKRYSWLKNKSAASTLEMVQLLHEELGFSRDLIRRNSFVLYGHPDYLRGILKRFKHIAGVDIKEILRKRPKICVSNPDTISGVLDVLDRFKIPHEFLKHCFSVLTLSVQTVEGRLNDLKSLSDFEGLLESPRVLKLVNCQIKAKARMEYLKQLKFQCVSLNILATDNRTFEKHTREGADKTNSEDVKSILAKFLKQPEDEILEKIKKHPYWNCVPLVVITRNYKFLLEKKFRPEDIYPHLYVLCYPLERIQEKLELIRHDEACKKATKKQILSLVLYYIEKDFHFTGDGIWSNFDSAEKSVEQSADMLSINLVKFGQNVIEDIYPKRDYDWGKKTKAEKIKNQ